MANSRIATVDFVKASSELYPNVRTRTRERSLGMKSRSHNFCPSVHVSKAWPPRPWMATMLFDRSQYTDHIAGTKIEDMYSMLNSNPDELKISGYGHSWNKPMGGLLGCKPSSPPHGADSRCSLRLICHMLDI